MEMSKTNRRVRMNLSQTAKGLWQMECTAEFETAAECEKELDAAIKSARNVMAANGLKEVEVEAKEGKK
jgi:hypothetical protein